MPTAYVPANVHHDEITVPLDGELATGAGLVGIEEVADNCEFVRQSLEAFAGTNLAHTNVDNNFSVEQHIDGQLTTTGHINSGASIYTGLGGQVHSLTNLVADDHVFADKNVVAAHGNVSAPNGTVSGAAVSATGAITGGTVHANGALSCGAAGLTSAGPVTASGEGALGEIMGADFRYPPYTARVTVANVARAQPTPGSLVTWDPLMGWTAQSVEFECGVLHPFELPAGADLTGISIRHTHENDSFKLYCQDPHWLGPPPVDTITCDVRDRTIALNLGDLPSGEPRWLSVFDLGAGYTIDPVKTYWIHWIAAGIGHSYVAVRLSWLDPGPRNH